MRLYLSMNKSHIWGRLEDVIINLEPSDISTIERIFSIIESFYQKGYLTI